MEEVLIIPLPLVMGRVWWSSFLSTLRPGPIAMLGAATMNWDSCIPVVPLNCLGWRIQGRKDSAFGVFILPAL